MLITLYDRETRVPIVLDDPLVVEAMVSHNPDRFVRVDEATDRKES